MLYRQALRHRRDRRNLDKEAQWDIKLSRDSNVRRGEANTAAAVIPTGNDAEIEAQIARRRMEKLAQNPGVDNTSFLDNEKVKGGDNEIR
jgi:hypothetical protein